VRTRHTDLGALVLSRRRHIFSGIVRLVSLIQFFTSSQLIVRKAPCQATHLHCYRIYAVMIRKLKSGQFRLYSRKKSAQTGKRRNLGTFATLQQAKKHEREVQYFKRH
jgi:hypothetical protein